MKATRKRLLHNIFQPVAAIIVAFAIGAVMIWLSGKSPLNAYRALFYGAFGSKANFSEALIKTIPLILCGLCVAICFRSSFFNIGAEGQFYMGALVATWIGVSFNAPTPIMFALLMGGAFLAGGLWCILAGWLKVKLGCSEVINTIMLNYVATGLTGYAVNGPLQESAGFLPQSDLIARSGWLPVILSGTRLHVGLIIALLCVLLVNFLLFKTVFGYQIRAVGLSPKAAEYAGINSPLRLLQTCLLSGGLAGLAGAIELMGITHRLYEVFSPGYGFDAIAVSLLAGNNPLGIIASAFLFGVLRAGSSQMQMSAGISSVLIYMIQALVIVFILLSTLRSKFKITDRLASKEVS
jgi:ABC-type uncharacterized transport system permease subunit